MTDDKIDMGKFQFINEVDGNKILMECPGDACYPEVIELFDLFIDACFPGQRQQSEPDETRPQGK